MSFAAALAAMEDEQLAGLIDARPDLCAHGNVWSFGQLADLASRWHSQSRALAELDELTRRVFDLVVLAEPPATTEEVCDVAGGVLEPSAAQPVLDRLAGLALVWRDDTGRWHLPGQVRAQLLYPAGLGRPFHRLAKKLPKDQVRAVARALDLPEATLPDAARNRTGVTKDQLVHAISLTLADAHRLTEILDGCPDRELADRFLEIVGHHVAEVGLDDEREVGPVGESAWLEARALVVRTGYDWGEIPREVGLALRHGRPFPDLRTEPPPLVPVPAGPPGAVDAAAAGAAQRLLDAVGAILFDVADDPITANKSGGVGVRPLKAVARSVDRTSQEAAQILELMSAADLIGITFAPQGTTVTTTDLADQWLAAPPAQRWLALVHAWLTTRHMIGAAGGRNANDKPIAPVRGQVPTVAGIVDIRSKLLNTLATGPEDEAIEPASLEAHLGFHGPDRWSNDHPDLTGGGTLLDTLLAEAELLGATGAGGLSSPIRCLLLGDLRSVERVTEEFLPTPVDELLVQADLTIVAPGPIAPDLAAVLGDLATVESRGGATTWRLSEASVRSALDAGHDPADLLALLDARAVGGVPQPVRYLIDDVARRHGSVRVRSVGAVIRCDDEALLASIAGHRRLRSSIELVAPTIAVSTDEAPAVLAALREAGFLPVLEDAGGEIVVPTGPSERAPVRSRPVQPGVIDDDTDGAPPWWSRAAADSVYRGRNVDGAAVVGHLRQRERATPARPATPPIEAPVQAALADLHAIQSARNADRFDEEQWLALPVVERLEQAMRYGIDVTVLVAGARTGELNGGVLFCDADLAIIECDSCPEAHSIDVDDIVSVEVSR